MSERTEIRLDALAARVAELEAARDAAPADVAPQIPEVCGNCQGWRALAGNPVFGQCMPSMKGLQSPLVTPNRSSCTGWVVAERLKASHG
jgi:hypothetical protein